MAYIREGVENVPDYKPSKGQKDKDGIPSLKLKELKADVKHGIWTCCKRAKETAKGCSIAPQHALSDFLRCCQCGEAFRERQHIGKKSNLYDRHLVGE